MNGENTQLYLHCLSLFLLLTPSIRLSLFGIKKHLTFLMPCLSAYKAKVCVLLNRLSLAAYTYSMMLFVLCL